MIDVPETKPASLIKAEEKAAKANNYLKVQKKKANEEKRKKDTHNKIVWGGMVQKFFPECIYFEKHELERIMKSAFNSEQCKTEIIRIKNTCNNRIQKE